jgi:hypothetical protein
VARDLGVGAASRGRGGGQTEEARWGLVETASSSERLEAKRGGDELIERKHDDEYLRGRMPQSPMRNRIRKRGRRRRGQGGVPRYQEGDDTLRKAGGGLAPPESKKKGPVLRKKRSC